MCILWGKLVYYAGEAYEQKVNGEIYPVANALKWGIIQEDMDTIIAPHSAYTNEDLPSDYQGARFGAEYFNPNSPLTLGQQLHNFFTNEDV